MHHTDSVLRVHLALPAGIVRLNRYVLTPINWQKLSNHTKLR